MTNTTARNWFMNEFDFRQLCGDAVSQAKGEKAEEFAQEMMRKANNYGLDTFISPDQMRWLCRLADHDMPEQKIP